MSALAIVNSSAPFGTGAGQESLDMAMATASFGQDVSLFFVQDGVFQLLNRQNPEDLEHKNYSKTFAALEFYDIENIYVCADSLVDRQLSGSDLCVPVTALTKSEIQAQLHMHQTVLRF